MYETIEQLKSNHLIWQGAHTPISGEHLSTGFDTLDQKLEGGYPKHGVVEIQSLSGIGELRLMFPHIRQSNSQRLTVFIQPPGNLCAEQLEAEQVDHGKVLIIYPETPQHALWAAEQCLKSGACEQVLLWHSDLEVHQARRLQVASEEGDCLQFIFRHPQEGRFSLPVSLSMTLSPHRHGLEVTVTKRKGGWPQGSFILHMDHLWPSLTLVQDSPVVVPFPLLKQG
ncbi:translesion DNA synthesis-associated protein ImuA [Vibrio sp. ZSDE26]|uniref:Translesion DNA synthesis-associated protein ImuA n=1 Tax=Vibrio amylolyticus TaxID=2847292 RepID=A0A9X1XFL2_9VIBR|nr:translesion DNA synthesis-associated protein ImuA [Vibrio amylolyticus]MCK6262077.1 translesion DNA synthesis-associated protein ImuA [Vibrio amylolyticus]